MEKSVVTKSAEQPLSDSATVDADAVFLYLTEARYPSESSDILKRAIRRKAAVCVVRDGVLYVQKKKKDNSILELRFRTREEQVKILAACHLDPTAGYMGEKRTSLSATFGMG
ncbi:hypothetical protein EMCRGX_G008055 [Ephydatia muelleri]|eukprot:Em0148g10a